MKRRNVVILSFAAFLLIGVFFPSLQMLKKCSTNIIRTFWKSIGLAKTILIAPSRTCIIAAAIILNASMKGYR